MSSSSNVVLGSTPSIPLDGGVVVHASGNGLLPCAKNPRADEIAIISHELRNALGVVRNAARLLRVQLDGVAIERARVLIERQVGLMNRHVEDLLSTSLKGERKHGLRLAYVDLRGVLTNSCDAIAADFARRGHRLVINLPPDALWVHADGVRLEQVFSNLLINAGKYTRDGGEISLTLERLERCASVRIRDSGIGLAPAQLARIFELFVQVDATELLAEGGRGIGLAVVRDLIEIHGGSVTATSAGLNFGSEFTVLLPALWNRPEDAVESSNAQ